MKTLMYIHGFRSGANGSKGDQLRARFGDRYRIVVPELDADPDSSLEKLNRAIASEKPDIIVGTSLGGWMTLMSNSGEAQLVIVNPSLKPQDTLSKWVEMPLEYFCRRQDGVQTYTLTQPVLDKYLKYDALEAAKQKAGRLHALCSTADELLGTAHADALANILPPERLVIVDDFKHRCDGPGLEHLFDIIEGLASTKAT